MNYNRFAYLEKSGYSELYKEMYNYDRMLTIRS